VDTPIKTASDVAADIMKKARWDVMRAVEMAMEQSSNAYIRDQVMRKGWEHLMRDVGHVQRDILERQAMASAQVKDSNARLQRIAHASFLETYVILGMPLRNCTDDDLRRDIGMRKSRAETEMKRAEFERRILKEMRKGTKVSDTWSDSDLEALAKKVFGAEIPVG
jgi:hypothetical protein